MPDDTPPLRQPRDLADAPTVPVSDHTEARHKAQLEQMQDAFAENLVDAFNTLVIEASRVEGSRLETLTIGQMDELIDCLRTTVTTPPPEGGKPFVPYDKDRDNPLPPKQEPTG